MKDHTAAIVRFFTAYADRFNASLADPAVIDTDGMVNSFADYFVEASAKGVKGGKNGLMFRVMIPRGFRYYRKIGTTAMNVASVRVTPIDDMHVMAHVDWDSRYRKDGRDIRIPFTNIYMLQIAADGPKVFAYVTGDEEQVLRDHGLI